MRLDPREELLPTVKSRSQALTWLRGALRWCAWNCYKPITQPWPTTGQARPGPVHAAILASFKSDANKNPGRVESLLWLYYVVELVQALLEREVRRQMEEAEVDSLALYPERRHSEAPTAQLVINALEGHRRHRLLDEQGRELRRFHDELSPAAQ